MSIFEGMHGYLLYQHTHHRQRTTKNLPCKDAGSWPCSTIIDILGELAGVVEISVASPGIANKPQCTKGLVLDELDPGLLCEPGEPRSGLDEVPVRKE